MESVPPEMYTIGEESEALSMSTAPAPNAPQQSSQQAPQPQNAPFEALVQQVEQQAQQQAQAQPQAAPGAPQPQQSIGSTIAGLAGGPGVRFVAGLVVSQVESLSGVDQSSVDQIRDFNPTLAGNLQRLVDLFAAARSAI
jgi:hypothetical protein